MPKPAKGPEPINPANLIVDGSIVANEWTLVTREQAATEGFCLSDLQGKVILPFATWSAQRDQLGNFAAEFGVWLDSDESAELLGNQASELPLIAVHFPAFADGRGFTTGRLLRERFGFAGELRAVGGFIRDQLTYLRRCGFNAFASEGETPLDQMLDSMNDFSDSYQAAVDEPLPVFRRRDFAA